MIQIYETKVCEYYKNNKYWLTATEICEWSVNVYLV